MDARVFALKNRSTAIKANRAVLACQQFYSDVQREFSAEGDHRGEDE